MDKSPKMTINKKTQALNDKLNKMDLIDIYRTFHPKTTEYTLFSSTHGTFSRIDHILGYKSSLGKFKKTEISSSIFSNHNVIRLDTKLQEIHCKKYKHMEAKQYTTKQPRCYWRNQRGNKKYLETNDNENITTQNLWNAAKAVLRGKFIAIQTYLKKQEKSQINNLTLHLKQLEKELKKNKVSIRKEIIKIRAEINEIEMKETIAKINKKAGSLRR